MVISKLCQGNSFPHNVLVVYECSSGAIIICHPLVCLDVTPASFETPEGRPGSPSSVLGKNKKGTDVGKFLFTRVTENATTLSKVSHTFHNLKI